MNRFRFWFIPVFLTQLCLIGCATRLPSANDADTVLQARISPDGTHIASLIRRAATVDLVVLASQCAGCERVVLSFPQNASPNLFLWTRDSQHLLFVHPAKRGERPLQTLSRLDVESQRVIDLFSEADARTSYVSVSATDGFNLPVITYSASADGARSTFEVDMGSGMRRLVKPLSGYTVVGTLDAISMRLAIKESDGDMQEWVALDGSDTPFSIARLSVQDRLLGSRVASSAVRQGRPKVYLLSSEGQDVVSVIEKDVLSGETTVLFRGRTDVLKVLFDPLTGEPQLAETDDGSVRWHALGSRGIEVLSTAAAWNFNSLDIDSISAFGPSLVKVIDPGDPPRYTTISRVRQFTPNELDLQPETSSSVTSTPLHIVSTGGIGVQSYVTEPKVRPCTLADPCPVVVFLHGGPRARDLWGYHAIFNRLANLHIATISVNYRGSRGFGKSFENSGNGQWGLTMVDDAVVSTRTLLQSRRFDSNSVGVMGGSHGAYMALELMRKKEPIYRCGAVTAATTDLVSFVEDQTRRVPQLAQDLYVSAGNPKTEDGRASLRARSPSSHLSDYASSRMLMIHGDKDTATPYQDALKFAKELRAMTVDIQFVTAPGEGHFFTQAARAEADDLTVEFLGACLAKAVLPQSSPVKLRRFPLDQP